MPEVRFPPFYDQLRTVIRESLWAEQRDCIRNCLCLAQLPAEAEQKIQARAQDWITRLRGPGRHQTTLDSFLKEYDLSSQEGVLLMCLAEALLRIPDSATADRLIEDRLSRGHWEDHLENGAPVLVNAASWVLLITGQIFTPDDAAASGARPQWSGLVKRAGEPLIRAALRQAMQLLAKSFVYGRDVGEAQARSREQVDTGLRYSYVRVVSDLRRVCMAVSSLSGSGSEPAPALVICM